MTQPAQYQKLIDKTDALIGKPGTYDVIKVTKAIPGATPVFIIGMVLGTALIIGLIVQIDLPQWALVPLGIAVLYLATFLTMHTLFPARLIARTGDELVVMNAKIFSDHPKAIIDRWTPPVATETLRSTNGRTTMRIAGKKYSVLTQFTPRLEKILRR